MLEFTDRINRLELLISRWKAFVLLLFFTPYVLFGLYHSIFIKGSDDPMLLYFVAPITVLLMCASTILSFEKNRWVFDLHTRTASWQHKFLFKQQFGSLGFDKIERFDLQHSFLSKHQAKRLVIILKSRPEKPLPMQRCWEDKSNFTRLDEICERLNQLLEQTPAEKL